MAEKQSWKHCIIYSRIIFSNSLPWMHRLRANHYLWKRHSFKRVGSKVYGPCIQPLYSTKVHGPGVKYTFSSRIVYFQPGPYTLHRTGYAACDMQHFWAYLVFHVGWYHSLDTGYKAGNYSSVDMLWILYHPPKIYSKELKMLCYPVRESLAWKTAFHMHSKWTINLPLFKLLLKFLYHILKIFERVIFGFFIFSSIYTFRMFFLKRFFLSRTWIVFFSFDDIFITKCINWKSTFSNLIFQWNEMGRGYL